MLVWWVVHACDCNVTFLIVKLVVLSMFACIFFFTQISMPLQKGLWRNRLSSKSSLFPCDHHIFKRNTLMCHIFSSLAICKRWHFIIVFIVSQPSCSSSMKILITLIPISGKFYSYRWCHPITYAFNMPHYVFAPYWASSCGVWYHNDACFLWSYI